MTVRDFLGNMEEWAEFFGRLSEGSTSELALSTRNVDLAVGEVLIIPSNRGGKDRVFLFRAMDYTNVLRRVRDMPRIAGTLVVEGDSYLAGVDREKLLYVVGQLLGYAEKEDDYWSFNAPRRLPEHFASVYRPVKGLSEDALSEILSTQVSGDIFIGQLLAGEEVLDLDVYIPSESLVTHLGIFGITGAGKSNLMLVFLKSIIDHNYQRWLRDEEERVSMLAIDPHDEFALGIERKGIQDVVDALPDEAERNLFGDFYYLTPYMEAAPKKVERYAQTFRISYREVLPIDIVSTMDVSDQMISYMNALHALYEDEWVENVGDESTGHTKGTIKAVERRMAFLHRSPIFVRDESESNLIDVISALERGRTLVFNTSLLSDMEQYLSTTILARTIFELRKAVKSSLNWKEFEKQLEKRRLPNCLRRSFLSSAREHYQLAGNSIKRVEQLPPILITIEEAPAILSPSLMRFENIYKDISRQGRKFRLGLAVVSQQVSVLDRVILSQINTEFNMLLTNADEIREAIKNASKDISGFDKEFKVLSRGQFILTASYRDTPLVLYVPKFDDLFEKTRHKYQTESKTTPTKIIL